MVSPRLISKELLVADIWSFLFSIPTHFEWKGGQHTVVMLDHPNPDERGTVRTLSFASLPFEGYIQLVTHCPKENSSTFKRALRDLEIGGSVTLTPGQESFAIDFQSSQAVFIVGGIGIAAIRSLLVERDHFGEGIKGHLFYYAPSGEHLFRKDFDNLAQKHPEFIVEYLVIEELQERGSIKEAEQHANTTYYFSGVYTRQMLSPEGLVEHLSEQASEEREEIDFLAKLNGLK